jgi:hypothetical protein
LSLKIGKLTHNVKFNKNLFPGIFTFNPVGLISPPMELLETVEDDLLPDQSDSATIFDDNESSDKSLAEIESNLRFSTPVKEEPDIPPEDSNVPTVSNSLPDHYVVLQPVNQKSPKDILLSIDESNILPTKRRAHLALVDKDINFHIQSFLAGFQFFNQTLEAPIMYFQAMKHANSASWCDAIGSKLGAMDRIGVWEIVEILLGADLLNTVWIFCKNLTRMAI